MPPSLDVPAAERLNQQLTQLVAKIDWLLWLRSGQRKALLGDRHSDNWKGAKRNRFEADFARHQAALAELKSAARTLQAKVNEGIEAARAAGKTHP